MGLENSTAAHELVLQPLGLFPLPSLLFLRLSVSMIVRHQNVEFIQKA